MNDGVVAREQTGQRSFFAFLSGDKRERLRGRPLRGTPGLSIVPSAAEEGSEDSVTCEPLRERNVPLLFHRCGHEEEHIPESLVAAVRSNDTQDQLFCGPSVGKIGVAVTALLIGTLLLGCIIAFGVVPSHGGQPAPAVV